MPFSVLDGLAVAMRRQQDDRSLGGTSASTKRLSAARRRRFGAELTDIRESVSRLKDMTSALEATAVTHVQ